MVYWPPGFPALLALVQGMLGTSGNSLLVLQISLAAVIGFLWAGYVRAFAEGQESAPGFLRGTTIGIWLALFVSITCHALLANTAQLALTGAIFWILVRAWGKNGELGAGRLVGLAALLGASLLLHSSGMALIAGIASALFLLSSGPFLNRAVRPGALVALSLVPWFVSRLFLSQKNSHVILLHPPLNRFWKYPIEIVQGIGEFVLAPVRMSPFVDLTMPPPSALLPPDQSNGPGGFLVGLVVIALGLAAGYRVFKARQDKGVRWCLVALLLGSAAICAMFIVVHIHSRPAARFLWQIPLAIFPVILLVLPRREAAFLGLAGFLFAATVITGIKSSLGGGLPPRDPSASALPNWAGYREYRLSLLPASSTPDGEIAIIPPSFKWNWTRWPKDRRDESVRDKARILQDGKVQDWWE